MRTMETGLGTVAARLRLVILGLAILGSLEMRNSVRSVWELSPFRMTVELPGT